MWFVNGDKNFEFHSDLWLWAFCEHAVSGEKKNSDVENTAISKGFQSKRNLCFKIRGKKWNLIHEIQFEKCNWVWWTVSLKELQCYEVVLASYCMSCNYIFHRNRDKSLVLQKVSNKCVFVYIWYLQHFQLKLLICWLGFVPFFFF